MDMHAVYRKVAEQQKRERASPRWRQAVEHLREARDLLKGMPVPWQNDEIYHSIEAIDRILDKLE